MTCEQKHTFNQILRFSNIFIHNLVSNLVQYRFFCLILNNLSELSHFYPRKLKQEADVLIDVDLLTFYFGSILIFTLGV